jgi:Tfp pilus assembly protein PilW
MKATPFTSFGRNATTKGMTLVEIMISSTLVLMFAVGIGSVFLQVINSYHYEVGKLQVNKDIRGLTSEMTDNATYANYFMIFPNFATRTQTFDVEVNGSTTEVTVDASVNDGESGDFLLLVYHNLSDTSVIEKLIGYYRSPDDPDDPDSEGPVRRFELEFSPGKTGDIWDMLPAVSSASNYPEVVELSQGLADGKLFYNFRDRSVMVKGNIIHPGSLNKRATNTYNFTISPRG